MSLICSLSLLLNALCVELSSLLVNMRLEGQISVAQALRHALWQWINTFPADYSDAAVNPRKLEGSAERLYDVMQNIVDADRRIAFWPTVTLLLATSPDRCKQLETALTYGLGTATSKVKSKAKPGRVRDSCHSSHESYLTVKS